MGRKENAEKARKILDAGIEVVITFKERTKPDGMPYLTCLVEGRPVAGASGGGYCRTGSCLGDFANLAFPDLLEKLDLKDFYGFAQPGLIDGSRGETEVGKILKAIGYDLTHRYGRAGCEEYVIRKI